jgi:hypothetical protein
MKPRGKHSEETKRKIGNASRGRKHSDETKQKISKNRKGKTAGANHPLFGTTRPDSTRQKMRENHKGMTGRKHSPETRKKMSETAQGRTVSTETREKLRVFNTGKTHSSETKRKLSKMSKGRPNPNKGVPLSLDHRENISKSLTGEKNPNYCYYAHNNIPKYDLYVSQLEPYEACRKNSEDENILEVTCAYCGKWFIPTRSTVRNRVQGIAGHDTHRFYCSKECKVECPLYGRKSTYKGTKSRGSREVQPELRQLVFARDKHECQKCGSVKSLHCHHVDPVKTNPIESADIDVCITLCKSCHKWIHTQIKGCKYHELAACTAVWEMQTVFLKEVEL